MVLNAARYSRVLARAGMVAGWLAAAPTLAAQQAVTAPNAVYVELLGNGLLYTLNYDRLFTPHVSGRVGLMLLAAGNGESAAGVLATPLMVNYLVGEGNSHFEAGAGILLINGAVDNVGTAEDEGFSGSVGTATLGYRYQRPGGGFIFRIGVTPFFGLSGGAPWAGISFGYGF